MDDTIERGARALWRHLINQPRSEVTSADDFGFEEADDGLTILDGAYDLRSALKAALDAMEAPSD